MMASVHFADKAVSAIRARDKQEEFMFVSRQTPRIEKEFPQVDFGDFDKGMVLVEPHGKVHVGADAIHFIVSRLPYFRLFAWMYRVPGFKNVIRWVYSWIAANRLNLSRYCSDSCEINAAREAGEKTTQTATCHSSRSSLP